MEIKGTLLSSRTIALEESTHSWVSSAGIDLHTHLEGIGFVLDSRYGLLGSDTRYCIENAPLCILRLGSTFRLGTHPEGKDFVQHSGACLRRTHRRHHDNRYHHQCNCWSIDSTGQGSWFCSIFVPVRRSAFPRDIGMSWHDIRNRYLADIDTDRHTGRNRLWQLQL